MTCYEHRFCGDSLISSSLKFQCILRTAARQGSFATHGVKTHSTQLMGDILHRRDLHTQHTAIGDTYTLTDVRSGACAWFIYSCALYGPKRLHHYYVQAAVRWEEKPTRGGTMGQSVQQPLLRAVTGVDCPRPWSCRRLCASHTSLAARTASVLTWRSVPITGSSHRL